MADSKKYDGSQWEHSLRKLTTATEAVENPLYSDGTAITSYTIKGNTVQDGTPTPSNPVAVNGVGEETKNLVPTAVSDWEQGTISISNGSNVASTTRIRTIDYYAVEANKQYYLTIDDTNYCYLNIILYNSNKVFIAAYGSSNPQIDGAQSIQVEFTNNAVAYCRITIKRVNQSTITANEITDIKPMFAESTTPVPFEPYGYKIPISSGQQTIDIYIGDLPLLKSLDGTAVDEISNGTLTRRVDSDGSVLPTPTTTQITMPSIPTTEGANSISVDTTVQPSEFTATWTGWHDSTVKEWDGTNWQ